MGRRAGTVTHLGTGEVAPHRYESYRIEGKTEPAVLCGDPGRSWKLQVTEHEDHVDCTACRKIIAKRKLEAEDAPDLKLVADHAAGGYGWRYFFQARLNGEQVGWIGYAGAYGKGTWTIVAMSTAKDDDEKIERGHTLATSGHEHQYEREDGTTRSVWIEGRDYTYKTKEDALLAVPDFVAQGRLKSIARTISDAKAWRIELARRQAAHVAREQRAAEAHNDLIEGLSSIQTRAHNGELVLTNSEAAALATAISRLAKTREDR